MTILEERMKKNYHRNLILLDYVYNLPILQNAFATYDP